MKQILLPNARSMPALGLGTWDLRGSACFKAVQTALQIGYRHIDTAEMYANEEEIGKALKAAGIPRNKLFITTKVWTNHHKAKDFKKAAEDSLKRLGLSQVDLLLIHWPNDAVPLAKTLGALCQLAREGKTLAIGVSNFTAALLNEAVSLATLPLSCDQVPYSLSKDQAPLLGYALGQKISLCAYTPLEKGRFLGDPRLREIARKHGKTPAQVALRWLVQQDGVAAIPKASVENYLRENFEVFDFELEGQDFEKLTDIRG